MASISAALSDLINRDIELGAAVDTHFTDDYRQRTDGVWFDRSEFVDHIAHLRRIVELDRIDVLEKVTDGGTYAERHVVRLRKAAGEIVEQEVYVFGERDQDGRFRRIEATTLMLAGQKGDRRIGSAR